MKSDIHMHVGECSVIFSKITDLIEFSLTKLFEVWQTCENAKELPEGVMQYFTSCFLSPLVTEEWCDLQVN